MRRENPSLDDRMDRGGHEDVLVEGVKRIDFAYWDSDKKDWVDEWDTRRLEKKSILPVRVRIGVVRGGRDREGGALRDPDPHRPQHGDPEILMRTPDERPQRGVALLMVVVAIAILTAVAAEFAYQTRVDLEMATHQRDALRAEYLAKSSMGLARMLLLFQKQLDRTTAGSLPAAARRPDQPADLADGQDRLPDAPGAAPPGAGTEPQVQHGPDRRPRRPGRIQYGGFAGCFDARIEDEQEKLNVNALVGLQTGTAQGAVQGFYNLIADKRFDFVFDREDANRVKAPPPRRAAGDQGLGRRRRHQPRSTSTRWAW